MQKIILDTNALVSALIQKSYPYYMGMNVASFKNRFALPAKNVILC
jgi:predicted nucleic acid-binding protein